MKKLLPLIIHANYYRFRRGEVAERGCVHSRMQLNCHSGHGTVTVNQETFTMKAGTVLLLPWKHHIVYRASRSDPFYVSGLHLIPHCNPPDAIPWFQTAHDNEHPLANIPWMADVTSKFPQKQVLAYQLHHQHNVLVLAAYVCGLFHQSPINEQAVRHATQNVLYEWESLQTTQQQQSNLPNNLQRVCDFIKQHIQQQFSLDELAHIAQCSPATLHRMSKKTFNCTMLQWHRQQQLHQAAEMLRSSTSDINQIASDCGFDDALYFSRCFKQQFTYSPRNYRQQFGLT